MDVFLFISLLILVFIGIPIAVVVLLYLISKKTWVYKNESRLIFEDVDFRAMDFPIDPTSRSHCNLS